MVFGGWGRSSRRRFPGGPFNANGGPPYGGPPLGDPYYGGPPFGGPAYGRPGFGRYRGPRGGGSCARDACLLEGGCCLGEALTGNCLVLATLLAPRLLWTVISRSVAGTTGPGRVRPRLDRGLVAAIDIYQDRISPRLSGRCRFTPSCSNYAREALLAHGARRGGVLAVRRLCRCRPYGPHGPDPVPLRSRGAV
jgi:putative membrane protein insertion efficiency factor